MTFPGPSSQGQFDLVQIPDDQLEVNSENGVPDHDFKIDHGLDVFGDDRLPGEPISFKRKQNQAAYFRFSKLFSSGARNSVRNSQPNSQIPRGHVSREQYNSSSNHGQHNGNGSIGFKEGGSLDWYGEGPGRRVGYDDFTAIDWIFEYTKERQRKRLLYSAGQGLLGHLRQLLDASHVWLILVTTGIAVGILAASIDIATDWLSDIKTGYCKNGRGGGKFYLNKGFCCWGHEGSITRHGILVCTSSPKLIDVVSPDLSECIDWTPWRRAIGVGSSLGGYIVEYIFFILYSVLFASCASILVRTYATYAKHSGIPEIKTVLGGFVMRRFMGSWTLLIKSLGLCLSVASGMWLGKEGPLVHVACCCANLMMKPFNALNHNEARKREVLSAAAAAGISVAFGAPIGGVLFSLEQLSYYFPDKTMWQSFVCAMVAAVTLQALNPFRTGRIVLYQVTYTRGWHRFEIVPFVILGILGGLYGGLFIKLNMKIAKWRKSSTFSHPVLEVAIVACISAIVNFPNIFMRAPTSQLVSSLFAECQTISDDKLGLCQPGPATTTVIALLIAAVLGFFLASITFGLEIPAGIILPSVAIGALYGRALGIAFQAWQTAHPKFFLFHNCEPDIPCVTPGTYAIIGAASALGGATRMTVSIVVIMFELTGALTYVIPIMVAVMFAKWCGDGFGKRGIYESWIHLNQYPFLDHGDDSLPPDVPASRVMTNIDDLTIVTAVGHTIESLSSLLATTPYRGFPVVLDTSNPILLGYISRTELSFALRSSMSPSNRNLPPETMAFFMHQPFADPMETLDLRPWMDQTPVTLNSHISFSIVLSMFQRLGLRYILFVNKGILQGLLTKKDIWLILNVAETLREEGLDEGIFREGDAPEETGLLDSDNVMTGIV